MFVAQLSSKAGMILPFHDRSSDRIRVLIHRSLYVTRVVILWNICNDGKTVLAVIRFLVAYFVTAWNRKITD